MTDAAESLTPEEIRRICGEVSDATVAAIIALDATVADLETAAVGDEDRLVQSDTPVIAAIREMLADERDWDDTDD